MTAIATTAGTSSTPAGRATALLGCGKAAGPIYLTVVAVQALVRDGFDPRKHAASMLTLGEGGWVQSLNFVLTGLLVVLGAAGLRRAGSVGRWAPRLLAVFGVGMAKAGVFVPDPALGFPVGTPDGLPVTMSWHGTLHFAVGGVGFLAFVVCCFLIARCFAADGARGRAAYSAVTGVVFLAAFGGIASGSAGAGVTVAFWVAVVLAFTWITLTVGTVATRSVKLG
ncbi:uncharacterized protein DUF998 [Kribbella amoyensis]|uniref:Uncharacterized protein DUF998 n=1 Tax=Kribbella amoyensis TaxID=996641 RepID=A0A561BZ92_9ACTN|nr:DUF998 domain-containing protein [Kribbella amoyensis]TWD84235.1 uncharacterized protein DUF998 [Kribbella amoyensis]